jgi:hypothetical protein
LLRKLKFIRRQRKTEIVSGAASPPAFLAGVLPRRRRGGFALIQVSCTKIKPNSFLLISEYLLKNTYFC